MTTPTPGDLSARLHNLLEAAVCPMKEHGCDGVQYPVGDPQGDYHGEQCQWCHERTEALSALSALPAAGGVDSVSVMSTQARQYADPNCSECKGSGSWYASGVMCSRITDQLTTPQPSAAEGGEERARKLYEPDEYEDAFKGRKDAAVGAQGAAASDEQISFAWSRANSAFNGALGNGMSMADAHIAAVSVLNSLFGSGSKSESAAPAAGKGVDAVRKAIEAVPPGYFNPTGGHTQAENRAAVVDLVTAALTRQPVAGESHCVACGASSCRGISFCEPVAGDGMVLVPREPSPEQVRAGTLAGILTPNQASAAYQAMLAAAPAATPTCAHEWVSGDNKYVSNTLICQRGYEIKPAATPTDGGEGS